MARPRINRFQVPPPTTPETPESEELPRDSALELPISHWIVQNPRPVLVCGQNGGLTYITKGKIIRTKEWADRILPFGVELEPVYASTPD